MEIKDIKGICIHCGRFPYPDMKMVDGCPVKRHENGQYHIGDFNNKTECELFVDRNQIAETVESQTTPDYITKVCFINRDNQCYGGCGLMGDENECLAAEFIKEYLNKLFLEEEKIELEIRLLKASISQHGIQEEGEPT